MKNFLKILIVFVCLSACTPTQVTRGNYLFEEDIQVIKPYSSTQYDVLNLLGSPTARAVFDENIWYYVGLKTEKKSFFDEKVTARQTVKITFDDTNTVTDVARVDGKALDVPLETAITPTSGNEVTFLQQVLGNVGKFNPQGNTPNPAR
jgi:outer membrane protein assembly factor BamE (lipoprotein component of BamABCDE complex)